MYTHHRISMSSPFIVIGHSVYHQRRALFFIQVSAIYRSHALSTMLNCVRLLVAVTLSCRSVLSLPGPGIGNYIYTNSLDGFVLARDNGPLCPLSSSPDLGDQQLYEPLIETANLAPRTTKEPPSKHKRSLLSTTDRDQLWRCAGRAGDKLRAAMDDHVARRVGGVDIASQAQSFNANYNRLRTQRGPLDDYGYTDGG